MSTFTTAPVHPTRRTVIALWVARVLLAVMGLAGLAGATYFSFFATPEEGGVVTAFDWFIAAWKLIVSLGFLFVAMTPGMDRTLRAQMGIWLVLADIVFGLIKYFGYDEREAINLAFFAVNAVLLGLLHLARRQRDVA